MNFQYLEQNTEQKFDVSMNVIAVGQTKFVGTKQTALQECTLRDPSGRTEAATVFQGSYSPPLNNSHVGKTLIFKLSHSVYKGKNQYAGYWQCPNPQENQVPQQGQQPQPQQPAPLPENTPQAGQQPPPQMTASMPVCNRCQSTLAWPQSGPLACPKCDSAKFEAAPPQNVGEPQRNMTYAYEVTPEVADRISRSVALEAASRCFVGKTDTKASDVISMAISYYDWVATGNVPQGQAPAAQPEGPPPGDDGDIPF